MINKDNRNADHIIGRRESGDNDSFLRQRQIELVLEVKATGEAAKAEKDMGKALFLLSTIGQKWREFREIDKIRSASCTTIR